MPPNFNNMKKFLMLFLTMAPTIMLASSAPGEDVASKKGTLGSIIETLSNMAESLYGLIITLIIIAFA